MTPADPEFVAVTVLALAGAAGLSFVLTPAAAALAVRVGAIDRPGGHRRVHVLATPRGGGLAVALAFSAVAVVAMGYALASGAIATPRVGPLELAALVGGTGLAAVIGFLDDRLDIRARWQFLGQAALAMVVVVAGIRITFINNPFGPGVISFVEPFALAFTVLWVVGMINSINFIDGLDGLSAGVSLIAAMTLAVISLGSALYQPTVALLCAVLVGALAGFLPWNFHPARVFIGTAGVYVIGYALAVLSILGTAKVAVALLVLGVPIIDTFWIIVRRLVHGQSPFTADRGHFHHRLLDLGLSHRRAVLLIYGICLALAALSLLLSGRGQLYAFLGVFVVGGVILAFVTRRGREAREALEARSYPDDDEEGTSADVVGTGRPGLGEPVE